MDRKAQLAENLAAVKASIPNDVHLIVVTKTFPLSDAQLLHELGVSEFGENRDQEGKAKAPFVPGKWHFQGQLQSNKLKSIANWADVIQTIDSLRYVELLSKASEKNLEVFIQVSLDGEEHRGGALPDQLNQIADSILASSNLKLQGLMAVAPLGEQPDSAFERLAKIHQNFVTAYPNAPFLSSGMSSDYLSAIAHGATHIRVGSSILGSRS
ncbi:MAG: YggS family pyridoxal phosphate-dependent enzyme [Candidatus Nanopelagicaceae bacterium]|nr:YggS family pyridoxal phosphate-dependent enzyme [Candidatus Nanopelagicaceae bacterium]